MKALLVLAVAGAAVAATQNHVKIERRQADELGEAINRCIIGNLGDPVATIACIRQIVEQLRSEVGSSTTGNPADS